MNNDTKIGVIGLISLLLVFGGNMVLTQNELNNAYYCPSTNEFGIFYGGISKTGLTAYPYEENRTDYVRCINSQWIKLDKYAEELNITPEQLLNSQSNKTETSITISYPNGKIYECNFFDNYINETIESIIRCNLK